MIFTIGHSTLSEQKFYESLSGKVNVVVDVRSHPTSKWPQFRKEAMEKWLPEAGVQYEWWPGLGGWTKRHLVWKDKFPAVDIEAYSRGKFPKQRIALNEEVSDRPSWINVGLRDYAEFMTLDEFLKDADRLMAFGEKTNVAIMCCEAVPWRCHRSMISDRLMYEGAESYHLFGGRTKSHTSMLGNRLERYAPHILGVWDSWKSKRVSEVIATG